MIGIVIIWWYLGRFVSFSNMFMNFYTGGISNICIMYSVQVTFVLIASNIWGRDVIMHNAYEDVTFQICGTRCKTGW